MSALAQTGGPVDGLERFHTNKDGAIICNVCDYTARQEAVVTRHILNVHDSIRDQKCNLGDYSTVWKEDLVSHVMSVHEKAKQQLCPQCDYALSSKQHNVILKHQLNRS
jgi:uncharacterized Zn finger protein (UPF0148 family)